MSGCPAGCGAEVRYVRMRSGARNPMEPEPSERGNVIIVRGGGKQLNTEEAAAARADGYDLWLSHLSVCPKQAERDRERTAQRRRGQFKVLDGGAS